MSHSTVLVIGENPEKLLAPFDENKRVKGYMKECWCVNHEAKNAGFHAAEAVKPFEQIRKEYHALPEDQKTDAKWKEVVGDYEAIEKKVIEAHPMFQKPDPKCTDCKGTGQHKTTYNPKSKWDWYELGGRWTGYFLLKAGAKGKVGRPGVMTAPSTNPLEADQARKCDIDWEGMKQRDRETAEKSWAEFQADLAKPDSSAHFMWGIKKGMTKEEYVASRSHPSTFAVLKDGVFYEKGSMGWRGIVTNEKDQAKWEAEFDKLLKELPESTLLSVYDVHI